MINDDWDYIGQRQTDSGSVECRNQQVLLRSLLRNLAIDPEKRSKMLEHELIVNENQYFT